MTDVEIRAHDLAVAFTKDLHQDMGKRLDENTLEYLLQSFGADYDTAYDYFKTHLS